MWEEKTEKPTKKRLQKAQERGEVATSSYFSAAFVFFGAVLLIYGLRICFKEAFQTSMTIGFLHLKDLDINNAFQASVAPLLLPVLGMLLGIFLISIAVHVLQIGRIRFKRPMRRKKTRGKRILFPILQLATIGIIGYLALKAPVDPALIFSSACNQITYSLKKIFYLAFSIGGVLLFLGIGDFIYQKWLYFKRMHMTHEEKKEEKREEESDPRFKTRMRKRKD